MKVKPTNIHTKQKLQSDALNCTKNKSVFIHIIQSLLLRDTEKQTSVDAKPSTCMPPPL